MIDPQLIAQLQTQIQAVGRRADAAARLYENQKTRIELNERMLSFHHFAMLAILEDPAISEETRDNVKKIAKNFKVKLRPTDPEYPKENKPA